MNQVIYTLLAVTVIYFSAHIAMYHAIHEPKRSRLETELRLLCEKPGAELAHPHCKVAPLQKM